MQSTDPQPTGQVTRPVTFRTEAAPALRVVGEQITPVLDSALGATGFEVFDSTGSEGSGPPPHSHPWDEGYVVLQGRLAVTDWSGGIEKPAEQILEPGASAFVPGGTTHSFQARSETCRFLIVTTPGAHPFFADMEETLHGATEDLDGQIAIAKRNGLSSPLF